MLLQVPPPDLVLRQRHPLDDTLTTCRRGAHQLQVEGLLHRDDGVLVLGVCLGHEETLDEGIN